MDVRDLVTQHYGGGNLSAAILHALGQHGVDTDHLAPEDLTAVDQLHAGGAAATRRVLDRLSLVPGTRLLDVGCGVGGVGRMAAARGAEVTGVDLTPEFVDVARALSERVGLAERTTFLATAGESLPFGDGAFEAAVMVHVGMNVPDKEVVFAEVHRVLEPGAQFALYEQVRTGRGELTYPLPWAEDERSSFVETEADYRRHLEAAGFSVEGVEDVTAETRRPAPPGTLTPSVVFGAAFAERIGNNVRATDAGILSALVLVARAR